MKLTKTKDAIKCIAQNEISSCHRDLEDCFELGGNVYYQLKQGDFLLRLEVWNSEDRRWENIIPHDCPRMENGRIPITYAGAWDNE